MLTRKQITDEVKRYIDTPMSHRGRLCGGGIDCIGLVVCVGMAFGVVLPKEDDNSYGLFLPPEVLLGRLRNSRFKEIPCKEAQPGDIVCFSLLGQGHCGFITDYGIIHVWGAVGRVVEHGFWDTVWPSRMIAAFSFPEVQ